MSCVFIYVINLFFLILKEDKKIKGEIELGYKFVYYFLIY